MSSLVKIRLPDFLIIGAMKAGTTTIFEDLQTQPGIYFPVHKEPHHLCYDMVLRESGLRRYAALFGQARPEQLCGEASTGYSKLPVYKNVPHRAREVLGANLRIIYSVREPVARTLSHHRHLYLAGEASEDFERSLRQIPDLIDFSRYAMQIEPWIETFGRERVHIVQLEEHAADRRQGIRDLCSFLGIAPRPELVQEDVIFRKATDKKKTPSWLAKPLQKVTRSDWYRYRLRPKLPDRLVARLKNALLTRPQQLRTPRPAVIDQVLDSVREDAERLRQIMGRDQPLWDFEEVRDKLVGASKTATRRG